jgi:hypothetical protein
MNRKERKIIFAPDHMFPFEISISLTDPDIVHGWSKFIEKKLSVHSLIEKGSIRIRKFSCNDGLHRRPSFSCTDRFPSVLFKYFNQ